jgi:hypothetical protein
MVSARGLVPVLGAAVWAGSWYLMHLEIHRWHHVKPSLRFNSDIAPDAHPGLPLLLLYAACVIGPSLVFGPIILRIVTHRTVR